MGSVIPLKKSANSAYLELKNLVNNKLSEVEKLIGEIIATSGADGMKDMGKVMGIASKQLAGKADGKTISNIVKAKLIA